MNYQNKYLKYKSKYLNLLSAQNNSVNRFTTQLGGGVKKSNEIYLFKAEWCPHCVHFKDTWSELQSNLKNKYQFKTFDSDADANKIKEWGVKGFPTIIKKQGDNVTEYVGPRDYESVRQFIETD
jgi:thioredoxin-like negative regulator of GroEL